MMRKVFLLVLCLALAVGGAAMAAEWAGDVTWLGDERVAGEEYWVQDMIPLADGRLLVSGSRMYHGEEADTATYREEALTRSEAFAVCYGADGAEAWQVALGEAARYGGFDADLLADGRVLLSYYADGGSFGQQYFMVNMDGQVDRMLPADVLRGAGALATLRPVGDGYLAGGWRSDGEGRYEPMAEGGELVYFDGELNEVWRVAPEGMVGGVYVAAFDMGDAIAVAGMQTAPKPGAEEGVRWWMQGIVKLSKADGSVIWQYVDDTYEMYIGAEMTPDGGFVYSATTPEMEGDDAVVVLRKVDAGGELAWEQTLEDGVAMTDIVAYGDELLMLHADDAYGLALRTMDMEGHVVSDEVQFTADDAQGIRMFGGRFSEVGADGRLYVYGDVYREAEESGAVKAIGTAYWRVRGE